LRRKTPSTLNVSKARMRLEAIAAASDVSGQTMSAAFVLLSGALNPVHQAHLQALEAARQAIESRTGVPVFAGFLSPSSDSYVQGKLESEAMALTERSLLCELATEESEWIDVCRWGWASSAQTTAVIGQQLETALAWTGGVRWNLVGWQVAGADFAARASLWRKPTPTVCISRGGEDTALVKASAQEVPGSFLIVDATDLEDVSSTAVRTLAAEGAWETLADNGWLAPAVLQRLRGEAAPPTDDDA